MIPPKTLNRQIDESIEWDIDFWVETKHREPEQMDLIDENEI